MKPHPAEGVSAVGQLTCGVGPKLSDLRNDTGHGDAFKGPPTEGLLEGVRDVIVYAYRDFSPPTDAMDLAPGRARRIRTCCRVFFVHPAQNGPSRP